MKRGYRSSASFPLKAGSRVIGVYAVYSDEAGFFDDEELSLLDELAGDLSFALETLDRDDRRKEAEKELAETALKQGAERLQRALEGTIRAMAVASELRDPYTAGHQRRVSQLAEAIALDLGLSEVEVDGIRIASQIHDSNCSLSPG